ncbi:MAG TPA: NAD-dependent epimerase/dehydratase family protein [Acidimicrobiales bacterium]|nr:NAD-dependent epimerase/dehydratase family protein [Acidimicrobiales bacterium]
MTGGAGFIGANLCRALGARDGFGRVVALDDLSTGRRDNLTGPGGFTGDGGIELVEGSILDARLLDEVMADADAVVHLAARPSVARSIEDPMASHLTNATGTLEVLEAARRGPNPHVIVASSSSVYGANLALPKREDMATLPVSPYAASKLATEAYALAYGSSFDLPVLAFRFFNVFGPLQGADHAYAAVVPAFVSAALRGDPLSIHGDGSQTRDFTFVGTVVEVLAEALVRRVTSPTPVNLAFGSRVSLLELANALEAVLGRPLPRRHGPRRPGDVQDSQADQTALQGLFAGVAPVALPEGLRATVDWFLASERFR